jgi:D-methionine transport system permease protein
MGQWLADFWDNYGDAVAKASAETGIMVGVAGAWAIVLGLGLAVLLVLSRPGRRLANPWLYQGLNAILNVLRSLPFIILLFFILPFTKLVAGSTIGVKGVIVPLVVYAAPYFARLLETAFWEVDRGVLEAYDAMGISTWKILTRVWLREALPSLILSLTTGIVSLIGASAMAGLVGGGGLGDLAYRYGFQRFEPEVMVFTVILLILLVQGLQTLGNKWAAWVRHN